jgi:hydroxymethylbilane synthase
MTRTLTIGTRGSQLARAQTNMVADMIRTAAPGTEVTIEIIRTTGDHITNVPLAQIGGKGLFTKELEVALLDGGIDLAVHSMKDLPTELPDGLALGAVPERERPEDALICEKWATLDDLPGGVHVGTSSLRRSAQLRAYRNDLDIVDLRGNIDTRIGKVSSGDLDAAILACAGLTRLGRADAIRQHIGADIMLSAVGQGALALEMREDDADLAETLDALHHAPTAAAVTAERACLAEMGGGCQVPLGALATLEGDRLQMIACVCSLDGVEIVRVETGGLSEDAAAIGRGAADELMSRGAAAIMADIQ